VTVGIPPPSRNHRTPTGPDTPASAAAASLEAPRAIAAQNRCRCSNRPTGGRPGDRINGRPARSHACTFRPIATPFDQVLRRPLESTQYVSLGFGQKARDAGIAVSMGSKGCCYDNAVAESFFATLKKELVHRRSWPTRRELASEVFEYIEAFFNRTRRHSTLGDLSPEQFETENHTRKISIKLNG
jgi:hypothetical protein